jgi:Nucleotidyl transferase AbiEii toxin, Type IV TA system
MPGHLPMAFKGGTSLSKVYGAIKRFSEDVDVTVDYKSLDQSIDAFDPKVSRTARDKYTELLKTKLAEHDDSAAALALDRAHHAFTIRECCTGASLRCARAPATGCDLARHRETDTPRDCDATGLARGRHDGLGSLPGL